MLEELLNKIKKYKEVYIIGHKNPDADSIFSSIILENILKSFNLDAKAIILDDFIYSENDIDIMNEYLVNKPLIINKDLLKEKNIILVDHNDPSQSTLDTSYNIIGSIDHHMESNLVYTLSGIYTSTSLYIYDLFKDIYNFNEYEKNLIALATMTDSEYLTTTRFTDNDKKLYDSLDIKLNVENIRNKYFKTTNFNIEPLINIKNNHKVYNIENININRTMIKAYEKDNIYIDNYLNAIKELENKWFMIWNEYDTKKTYIYYDSKLIKTYNYIITSSVLILKDLIKDNLL